MAFVAAEFPLGDRKYSVARIPAMTQWHIVRRLAPTVASVVEPEVLKDLLAMFRERQAAASAGTPEEDIKMDAGQVLELASKFLKPFLAAISAMSDADSEYVIQACLSVVSVQDKGAWCPVQAPGGGIMFPDLIDLPTMLHLTFRSIMANLVNFSFANLLGSTLTDAARTSS